MLARAVTTRNPTGSVRSTEPPARPVGKPWVCDECGARQPAGTVAHWRRAGRWLPMPKFGTAVHVYGDVRVCDACARGIAGDDPAAFWGRGGELRTETRR